MAAAPTGSQLSSEDMEYDFRHPPERLSRLLDVGSLVPLLTSDSSGVWSVRGSINGASVIAYCTDATTMGGALGAAGAGHIVEAIDTAVRGGCPVLGLWHSGGARLTDGVESMDGVGRMFAAMTRASGRVLQISVVLGPAVGAAAYGPGLTDVVIMSPAGRLFITGPDVVRAATGQQVDMDQLGGPDAHSRRSGVVHIAADSEPDAYERARRLTDLFSKPGLFDRRATRKGIDLQALLPESSRRAYDVKPLIRAILDDADGGGFEELQAKWAPNIAIGLGRLSGRTVGVLANNPMHKGGCLDSLSAEKASRFVRMCDSFGVPLLVMVDVPGYLPGVDEKWGGVVRRGAKLMHAFAEAIVPRVTLITRKSYGGAYIAMNSRSLGATAVFVWPQCEVAVMDTETAVGILHRKKLAAAPEEEREVLRGQLMAEYRQTSGGVGRAMNIGVVDEVIRPEQTVRRVVEALADADAERGQHGNIPL